MSSDGYRTDKINLLWMVFLTVIGGAISIVLATSVFDATVSLSGIICVGLIAVGRREGYLVGLYNSFSYSYIAYSNGLFGDVYLNLLFFVPTGIAGYVMWSRKLNQRQTVEMRELSWRQRILVLSGCLIGTALLGYLLKLNPRQNTPFIDATTNILSIVATFLMMWRYKEQWVFYIVLNIVTIAMWLMRYLAGGKAGDLMILMWSLFLINAMFGYWRWSIGVRGEVQLQSLGAGESQV